MKVVTSLLGDKWIIDQDGAKPEFGDRIFGTSDCMLEMLEKSQTSKKWAQRLQQLASAELNEDNTSIYVPDKKNFNWYREISLKEPEFRTHNDYFNGFLLIYPDDKRLSVSEQVAEPGAHYGPYYVLISNTDGSNGVVGFTEEYSDLPDLLENLKGKNLTPLPRFSTTESTVYDLCDGYRAETIAVEDHGMDIWTVSYHTAILSPDGEVVAKYAFDPNRILELRDSKESLNSLISKASKNQNNDAINKSLAKFKSMEDFIPVDMQDLNDKMISMSQNSPLKFTSADGKMEFLIYPEINKTWRFENGDQAIYGDTLSLEQLKNLETDAIRLCHERNYIVETKNTQGFSITSGRTTTLNIDNLYAIISDVGELKKLMDEYQDRHSEWMQMHVPHQEAIIYLMEKYVEDIEIISEKRYSVAELIKRMEQNIAGNNRGNHDMQTA